MLGVHRLFSFLCSYVLPNSSDLFPSILVDYFCGFPFQRAINNVFLFPFLDFVYFLFIPLFLTRIIQISYLLDSPAYFQHELLSSSPSITLSVPCVPTAFSLSIFISIFFSPHNISFSSFFPFSHTHASSSFSCNCSHSILLSPCIILHHFSSPVTYPSKSLPLHSSTYFHLSPSIHNPQLWILRYFLALTG